MGFDAPEALGASERRGLAPSSRSSRSGWRCACTTSPPAPATSSPTESSATTASPGRRTATSTSTPGRDFEREIVVKVNAPEVLRAELRAAVLEARARRARDEHRPLPVGRGPLPADGRASGRRCATPPSGNPCSVLTKSPLLLRDLPLMLQLAGATELQRVPLDSDARRARVARDRAAHAQPARAPGGRRRAEPRRHPDRRPDRAADARHQRRPAAARAAARSGASAAGATSIGGVALHLRREVRRSSWTGCATQRPELVPRYEALYGRGAYAPREERERLVARMAGRSARGARQVGFGRRRARPVESRRAASRSAPHGRQQERLF